MRLTSTGTALTPAVTGPRPLPSPRLAAWQAVIVAVAGGVALAAAFPPVGLWPLAAAGPALLTISLWRQRLRTALAAGAAFGLAFFFPLLSWLVNVAWYAWIALAVAWLITRRPHGKPSHGHRLRTASQVTHQPATATGQARSRSSSH